MTASDEKDMECTTRGKCEKFVRDYCLIILRKNYFGKKRECEDNTNIELTETERESVGYI
jgi:hypothetical protein